MNFESFKNSRERELSVKENEKDLEQYYYWELLSSYVQKFIELKRFQRKHQSNLTNPEIKMQMNFIDQERHQIHLNLIEAGSKLGKNKADVLIEILGKEENLEEYGLPEFSVKTYFENPKTLKDDEAFLVFDTTINDFGSLIYSEDHNERTERAKLLAKEISGRFISLYEGFSHESAETFGVVFPKQDIEKVAAIIRDNPKKFRLGKEFYE